MEDHEGKNSYSVKLESENGESTAESKNMDQIMSSNGSTEDKEHVKLENFLPSSSNGIMEESTSINCALKAENDHQKKVEPERKRHRSLSETFEAIGKSRWDSPRKSSERQEDKCPICLGPITNRSITDGCKHDFCYVCILEWSKVKAECPLCKKKFRVIKHTFNGEAFEQFNVPAPAEPPRFRYRTTMTGERYELLREIRRLQTQIMLSQTKNLTSQMARSIDRTNGDPSSQMSMSNRRRQYTQDVLNAARDADIQASYEHYNNYMTLTRDLHRYRRLWQASRLEPRERLIGAPDFRRLIYERGLRVRPAEENDRQTGMLRLRDTTPEFYAENPAQIHRLVPWLDRELRVLLHNDITRVHILTEQICGLISQYPIRSEAMSRRLGMALLQNTDHFLHEFYHFARSTCETLEEYDRQCHYQTSAEAAAARNTDSNGSIATSSTAEASAEGSAAASSAVEPARPREEIEVLEHHPPPPASVGEILFPDIHIPFWQRDHEAAPTTSANQPISFQQEVDYQLDPNLLDASRWNMLSSHYDGHLAAALNSQDMFAGYPPSFKERKKRLLLSKLDRMKQKSSRLARSRPTEEPQQSQIQQILNEPTPLVDLTEDDDVLANLTPPPLASSETGSTSSDSNPIHVRSDTPPIIQMMREAAELRRRKRNMDTFESDSSSGGVVSDPEQPGPSWRAPKRRKKKNPTPQSYHIRFPSSSPSDVEQSIAEMADYPETPPTYDVIEENSADAEEDLEVLCEMPPKHLRTPEVVTLEDDEVADVKPKDDELLSAKPAADDEVKYAKPESSAEDRRSERRKVKKHKKKRRRKRSSSSRQSSSEPRREKSEVYPEFTKKRSPEGRREKSEVQPDLTRTKKSSPERENISFTPTIRKERYAESPKLRSVVGKVRLNGSNYDSDRASRNRSREIEAPRSKSSSQPPPDV